MLHDGEDILPAVARGKIEGQVLFRKVIKRISHRDLVQKKAVLPGKCADAHQAVFVHGPIQL